MNCEGITHEQALKLELFGSFLNRWRQRRVDVRRHPSNELMVVTVGYPIGGGEPVVCVEPRDAYRRQLLYNDWRPIN